MKALAEVYLGVVATAALAALWLVRVHTDTRLGPLCNSHHPRLIAMLVTFAGLTALIGLFAVSLVAAIQVARGRWR